MSKSTTIQECFEVAERSPLVMAPSLDFDNFYGLVHGKGDSGDIAKNLAKTLFSMMQLAISTGVTLVEMESAIRIQAANHVYAAENHQPYEALNTEVSAVKGVSHD
jgi:hypothetical protein